MRHSVILFKTVQYILGNISLQGAWSHIIYILYIYYKPEMRHSGIPVGGEKVVVYIRHKRLPQTTN